MFPFAIINGFGSQVEKNFRKSIGKMNKILLPSVREFFEGLNGQTRMSDLPNQVLDAKTALEILQELRDSHGEYIDQKELKKVINQNLNILDAWAVDKQNENLRKQRESMVVQSGMDALDVENRVPLLNKKDLQRLENIPLASKNMKLAQNQAYAKYFNEVESIINENILLAGKDKLDVDKVLDEILKKADVNAKRARFWVEDQAAVFHTEQTRIANVRAGYTHYQWVTSGIRTRPSHAVHSGEVCSWSVGVRNLARPGARHPGEDYRCHCTARSLTEKEVAAKNLKQESPVRSNLETLIENYKGGDNTKETNTKKTDEFLKTAFSGWANSQNPLTKNSIEFYKNDGFLDINKNLRTNFGEVSKSDISGYYPHSIDLFIKIIIKI